MVPRPRTLASLGFLVRHAAGGAYALVTLLRAWFLHDVVRLLVEQSVLFRVFAPAWFLIPVGLALVALLAAVEVRRTLGRWRRHEPEPDVGLRVRALAYVVLACIFVNAFFLSTPETFSGPFRIRYPILGEISGGFAYGAYALWSRLLPWLRRVFSDRVRRVLDVVAMNVALLLVLAEVSLRVVAAFWSSPLLVTASSPQEIRRDANRERPGTLRFGFPMNRGGHYDTEFVARPAGMMPTATCSPSCGIACRSCGERNSLTLLRPPHCLTSPRSSSRPSTRSSLIHFSRHRVSVASSISRSRCGMPRGYACRTTAFTSPSSRPSCKWSGRRETFPWRSW